MATTELSDDGKGRQSVQVKDRDPRPVGAQDHVDAVLFDVVGDDLQAPITFDDVSQPAREEILEAGDCHGCGREGVHRARRRMDAHLTHRHYGTEG